MPNFQPNDVVVCVDGTDLEEYDIHKGDPFFVSSSISIPGQGDFLGLYSADPLRNTKKIFIVDASKFEEASLFYIRTWPETGKYEFVEEEKAMVAPEEEEDFVMSRVILPNSKIKDELENVIAYIYKRIKEERDGSVATH